MVKNNILEFIGFEYNNTLVSITNLKSELGFLQELDEIYQETKEAFPADKNNVIHIMVGLMFLRAHSEFYIGMSQFLKCHLLKAFISLRIAVEASFLTYYFTKHSEHAKDYMMRKAICKKRYFGTLRTISVKILKSFL